MAVDSVRLVSRFGKESVGGFAPETMPRVPAVVRDLPVVAPDSIEAMAEALRFAASERLRVLPAGAGEHLGRVAPQSHFDFVVSSRRMARIVEYEPEDMVAVLEAGVTLRAIAERAAGHAQRLGPDPSAGKSATVGGAVALDRNGPSRPRSGRWRDVVLGVRVVHADGRSSKTGGKVVKNVAGYDLSKLYVGSRGTLAMLVEINLRLVARPSDTALVVTIVERSRARETLLALHRSAILPSALLLVAGSTLPGLAFRPDEVAVCTRFEGGTAAVRWQVQEALRIGGGEEWPASRAQTAYAALQESAEPHAGAVGIRISSLPVEVPSVLECLLATPHPAWTDGAAFVGQFGVGTSQAQLPGIGSRELRLLQARVAAQGARLEIEHASGMIHPVARPHEEPELADLLRRTKATFDPEGRFAPLEGGPA